MKKILISILAAVSLVGVASAQQTSYVWVTWSTNAGLSNGVALTVDYTYTNNSVRLQTEWLNYDPLLLTITNILGTNYVVTIPTNLWDDAALPEAYRVWNGTNWIFNTNGPALPGLDSVQIGEGAGYDNAGGTNFSVGIEAGESGVGHNNFFLGNGAGRDSGGYWNFYLGNETAHNSTGNFNFAYGLNAFAYGDGDYNTAIGTGAGDSSVGDYNTFLGNSSGSSAAGNYNQFVGRQAGTGASGDSNYCFGYQAGYLAAMTEVYALGAGAGAYATNSESCLFAGTSAGRASDLENSAAIGHSAGMYASGSDSHFFGYGAGYAASGLESVIAIGNWVGRNANATNHLYLDSFNGDPGAGHNPTNSAVFRDEVGVLHLGRPTTGVRLRGSTYVGTYTGATEDVSVIIAGSATSVFHFVQGIYVGRD